MVLLVVALVVQEQAAATAAWPLESVAPAAVSLRTLLGLDTFGR